MLTYGLLLLIQKKQSVKQELTAHSTSQTVLAHKLILIQLTPAIRHAGAKGEKRYSSYSFLTSALDGGEVVSVTPRPRFSPGKGTSVHIGYGAWWASELI
jgi:hypothetical protein